LGDDLLAFLDARLDALLSPLVGDIAAELARSYQSATGDEYVATLARLYQADMCAFSAEAAKDVVGLFAQWKDVPSAHCEGSQRFLVDGRRPNCLSTFSSSNFSAHQGQLLVVWTVSLN